MSIANEIQRLLTSKDSIKAAIEEKGVIVGDGTIDTYAEFIKQITGSSIKNSVEGTIIFENTDVNGSIIMEHNLGVVPDLFLLLPDYDVDYTINASNAAIIIKNDVLQSFALNNAKSTLLGCVFETRTTYETYGNWFVVHNCNLTETTVELPYQSPAYDYRAGMPYKWIAATLTDEVDSGDYDQGYENGKNSVVDTSKLCQRITFTNLNLFGTKEVVLDLDNAFTFSEMLRRSSPLRLGYTPNETVEHITINCSNKIISMYYFCAGESGGYDEKTLKHLTLNVDTQNASEWNYCFRYANSIEIIDGMPLDFSNATNVTRMFDLCTALKEMRFALNTLKLSVSISRSQLLSTETIQSIIHGLADLTGGTAQTLTVHKTVYEKIIANGWDALITAKNWILVSA